MEALAAAFKTIADTQGLMLDELRQLNLKPATTNADAPASVSSHPTNVSPFENYDQGKEKFSQYLTRFEHYLALRKVTDDKQKVHLLSVSIGSEHYNNLVVQLKENEKVSDLEYDKLVESLTKLLTKQKSEVVAQHYFLNIKQQEKQTIMQFVTDLKKNLTECNFSVTCTCECKKSTLVSVSDLFLRCQFIRGIRDEWMRQQLIHLDLKTFDEFVGKAVALEASLIESKELNSSATASSSNNMGMVDLNQ